MLKNAGKTLILIFLMLLLSSGLSLASDDLSTILLKPDAYDNKNVEITGEVVGVAVRYGEGYFIQVNQDPYVERSIAEGGEQKGQNVSIAVFVKPEMFKKIKFFGDYRHKGDVVKIKGTFHISCPNHRGETDIHATRLLVLKEGYHLRENLNFTLALTSIVAFVVSLFLFFGRHKISEFVYRIIYK